MMPHSRLQTSSNPAQTLPGLTQSRKRSATALLPSEEIATWVFPFSSGRADAAFIASLHAPRRRKTEHSSPALAWQGYRLQSSGSSTQLQDLDSECSADAGSPLSDDASVQAFQDSAASALRPAQALEPDEDSTPSQFPACQPSKLEAASAQSSGTCVKGGGSPGSEPGSDAWQAIGSGLRQHRRILQLQNQSNGGVVEPSLQQVAAFQHPLSYSSPRIAGSGRPHANIVCDVKFSADGEYIATAGVDKQVRLTT